MTPSPARAPAGRASRGRSVLLWVLAILLTLAAGIYQRVTGPTHPARGSVKMGATEIRYRVARAHAGPGDHEVRIGVPGDDWHGTLVYRRYPTHEAWTHAPMMYGDGELVGRLPHQPPAGKVAYRVFLHEPGGEAEPSDGAASAVRAEAPVDDPAAQGTAIPPDGPVVLRFRGDVPASIVLPHVLVIFLAMLWSNRTGLEVLRGSSHLRRLSHWSLGLMVLGGLIFGPAMQWYAFGEFWTGFPVGHDLTDTKTLVACLAWLAAVIAIRRGGSRARWWVLGASLITLAVFLIPHSVLGSELDYGATMGGGG